MLLMNKPGTANFMVALLVIIGYAKVMGGHNPFLQSVVAIAQIIILVHSN